MSTDKHFLIVPASGMGSRMNAKQPKQHLKLKNGLSVLDQTLKTLLNIEQIKGCVVAITENDTAFKNSVFANHDKLLATAIGGKERLHSVISALNALRPFTKNNDWVLVHDAARPCVKASEIENLIKQLKDHPTGGLLATKVVDTIKKSHGNIVESTLDRSTLWQAQTPQMYRFFVLSKALENAVQNNLTITDEASSIEYLGLESILVEASKSNLKITTAEDLTLANFYLEQNEN
ncbi:2-C-methyl-D-erythritol 4-phosphate cytidylyltransferase (EC 2.7.7.60) [uncultured Gammaproteobacteria bacterium]|jgi:2-C-methyl-D-erythritol 4-phosphate cytidylyltransferase|uniref:2-C-methyl-D-erythritol 4-phosphate cytidylyltransferase (EC) n=3 Tax=sulfur-oxidizing symbionts TaxID=32036 RepID=A0ACA8ZP35_9GAMM|nr:MULTISPECIES: 2-C-methyl-D-erythritol 4-phosphate cytidylyltransferase [Gammaproteobacteria]CAC9474442.1 2-C-methyl-D-erythritol 4-phosphate cytidylyltransferase (EC 2.7.7.60) [uncultured Gammaproteobacteria bacterium]CAB5498408.1 2-C-methyl-D-erythritol 4-phosphate cytidylyltransferase (EC [Bathymodiolus azoricus thioautotrophic gill symbiont]CAB5499575.1 2-C-methyl-D-erythritol 4-phosphate cytidylyltransferase (EC [Bathymodiolus thermophilus thioautotrophic gill symbiont]CAC9488295.1 2-C-m